MDKKLSSPAPRLGSLADPAGGLELDAVIAERLFRCFNISSNFRGGLTGCFEVERGLEDVPGYSSEHNAAALVLAEMRRRGFTWYMDDHLSEADPTFWHIECWKRADSVIHGYHDSHSLPESICRAALKALATSK